MKQSNQNQPVKGKVQFKAREGDMFTIAMESSLVSNDSYNRASIAHSKKGLFIRLFNDEQVDLKMYKDTSPLQIDDDGQISVSMFFQKGDYGIDDWCGASINAVGELNSDNAKNFSTIKIPLVYLKEHPVFGSFYEDTGETNYGTTIHGEQKEVQSNMHGDDPEPVFDDVGSTAIQQSQPADHDSSVSDVIQNTETKTKPAVQDWLIFNDDMTVDFKPLVATVHAGIQKVRASLVMPAQELHDPDIKYAVVSDCDEISIIVGSSDDLKAYGCKRAYKFSSSGKTNFNVTYPVENSLNTLIERFESSRLMGWVYGQESLTAHIEDTNDNLKLKKFIFKFDQMTGMKALVTELFEKIDMTGTENTDQGLIVDKNNVDKSSAQKFPPDIASIKEIVTLTGWTLEQVMQGLEDGSFYMCDGKLLIDYSMIK